MPNLVERWSKLWSAIKGSPVEIKKSIAIPSDRVMPNVPSIKRFEPGKHYFSVFVNEMFLVQARRWWELIDPIALVVSEFTYDAKQQVVPFVVGPSLLEGKMQHVPHGMTFTDTQVAGVHPYVGGKFALSVILAQVRRDSYAKRLLQIVESVSSAFPAGQALESHLKVAGAVLEGVESLFGMADAVRPLVGHRWEYDDGLRPWLEPGFFALINAQADALDTAQLNVVGGQLRVGEGESAPEFRQADYLLYSLMPMDVRSDYTELPFHRTFQTALRNAVSAEEGSWQRAKATLIGLYQEMLASPDLTWDQVQQLADFFKDRLIEAKTKSEQFGVLSGDVGATGNELSKWFKGPDADQRANKLRELHKLLAL